ncbi:MAG: SpoIIE family protein phosphatase [Candidatus Marinimicrobia bacterium]|nr:SpoIIE family protein phosphatase [Candidatus Neomarinimicrobiota bacterium]
MKAFSKNIFLALLPVAVIFVVYIGDTIFFISAGVVEELVWLREFLLFGAIVGFVPLLASIKVFRPTETTKKFRVLLLAVLTFFAVSYLSPLIISPVFGVITSYALMSILFSVISIIGLIQLRDLIFFKQRKNTARTFAILMISIALVSIYGGLSAQDFQQIFRPTLNVAMVPILFAVFNSFRVSWIAYLSKKQKYLVLLACMIVVGGSVMLQKVVIDSNLNEYSYTVDIFVRLATGTISIYSFFGMIGLLLYLPTATLFDRKIRDIESLQSLSRAVSSVLDVDKLTEMISEFTAEYSNSQYSWLVLKEKGEEQFYLSSSYGLTQKQRDNMNFSINAGTSGLIYKSGEPLISQDVGREESTKHLRAWNSSVKSLIGYPLISESGVMGILYAAKNEEYGFDNDDIDLLGAFTNHIVIALENARLVESSLEKERLEHELRLAHEVQLNLLPKEVPSLPEGFDLAAASMPANEVGGDYFDFIEIDDDRIGIVIGDVSGKGTSAAFYMAEIKGMIQAYSRIYDSPCKILCDVNRALYGNMDSRSFISLTYAILDTKKRSMKYARAGHMPVLYYSRENDRWTDLKPKGIGLGMDRGKIFDEVIEEKEQKLKSGELYYFYTDGVSDAMNEDQEEFGEENIKKSLINSYELSSEETKANLITDIWTHIGNQSVHDDVTMIIMKIK